MTPGGAATPVGIRSRVGASRRARAVLPAGRGQALTVRSAPAVLALLALGLPHPAEAASTQEPVIPAGDTLVLRGVLHGPADHQSYREIPFEVPGNTRSLTVEFHHTGREERATIDLGLRDPDRFRGWSGGNRTRFTVAETWATPSYLAGALPEGTWHLILGVPHLRDGTEARWEATILLDTDAFAGATAPLAGAGAGPGWFRGDLHLHSGHSDGSCASRSGERIPCPLFRTLEVAAARGLDFVALTEHNTTSQHGAITEAQPFFDDLLLLPGQEITTFRGHLNVIGAPVGLEFQLGTERLPDLAGLLDQAESAGALVVINHPALPSGEACMGCGWSVGETPWDRIDAVEVFNGGVLRNAGGNPEGLFTALPFWEDVLGEGHAPVPIGASDNHDPDLAADEPSAVGRPATIVWARELSRPAILDGLRAGRVFIDLEGETGRIVDLSLTTDDGRRAPMGQRLEVAPGEVLTAEVEVRAAPGRTVHLVSRGVQPEVDSWPTLAPTAATAPTMDHPTDVRRVRITAGPGPFRWIRVELRRDSRLVALSAPVLLTSSP